MLPAQATARTLHAAALILVLLLSGAAAGLTAPVTPRPAAPADSMRRHAWLGFEIYALTDDDLRRANEEILTSYNQFPSYLGESPRRMAFVIFHSAAEAGRYDFTPLTGQGLRVLAWVDSSNAAPAPQARRGDPGFADVPTLAHDAGHCFLDAYADRNFGILQARAAADSGREEDPGPHLPRPGMVVRAFHPSHPDLPDWLEEAVASLCEPPALQQRRLEFLSARLDRRIPLADLLAMSRPGAGARTRAAATPRKAGRAGGSRSALAESAERAALFDAEALSLARFIADREDERFVGKLVDGVISGRTVGDVLNTTRILYSKPEALEKQWLEWIQSRTP
jgi:hypothetical protein